MILPDLIAVVTLLASLSVASERLVEIIKPYLPAAWFQAIDPLAPNAGLLEAKRKARIQMLAVVAGIVTAFLASPVISNYTEILGPKGNLVPGDPESFVKAILVTLALGFFASGGSGLWNTVLEYLLKVKGIKDNDEKLAAAKADKLKAEIEKAKAEAEKAKAEAEKAKAEAAEANIRIRTGG